MLSSAWKKPSRHLRTLWMWGRAMTPWDGGCGEHWPHGVCVTLQRALEHMETTHLGSLSGSSSFEEATHHFKVFFLFFFFSKPKDCNGLLRALWHYSSTCKGLRNTYVNREFKAKASTSKSWENSSRISVFQFALFSKHPIWGGGDAPWYFTNDSVFPQP